MARYSVIIPTRNRPDLVGTAVQSVLLQDFQDFELIISDNSDHEHALSTYDAVSQYVSRNDHVKYIRPERVMTMTNHWEWAVNQARGDYIGILTDRMVFRLHTLSSVETTLKSEGNPPVVAFNTADVVEQSGRFLIPSTDAVLSIASMKTDPFIDDFHKSDFRRMDMPRFLNSFTSRKFLDQLKREYGSVFVGTSPDYGFFLRVADQLDSFTFIRNKLLVKHSDERSNGKSFTRMKLTTTSLDFIDLAKREHPEFLALSPIPSEYFLVTNAMMREYETGRKYAVKKVFPAFDKQAFYNESMRAIRAWRNEGKDVSTFAEVLEKYRNENALRSSSSSWREMIKRCKRNIRSALGMRTSRSRISTSDRTRSQHASIVAALLDDKALHRANHALQVPGSPYLHKQIVD